MKEKVINLFVLFGMIAGLAFPAKEAFSQISAKAMLDSTNILIGDHVHFTLELTSNDLKSVKWPIFADTLTSQIEIVKVNPLDTIKKGNEIIVKQKFTITSFDSGFWVIPPISFYIFDRTGQITDTIQSEALLLTVRTVEVDTTAAIKPIKEPLPAPFTFKEAMPYIGIGLAAIVAILAIIWYFNKRKKAEPIFRFIQKPKIPPHELAAKLLEELRRQKLWQEGRIKEYHTQLTDIIRRYIEDRFEIMAVEMTSDEIISAFSQEIINQELKGKLSSILKLADLVKFAKLNPLPLEHDQSLINAVEFVDATKPLVNGITENEFPKEKLSNA